MSYCRWSSDDWKCDLYCYKDAYGGYTTHVAGRKHVGVPVNPHSYSDFDKWHEFYDVQMKFLENAKMKDIGLPYDGDSFNDPDLESFLERVNCLKEIGYHVPFYVLEDIEGELMDVERTP